MGIYCSVWIKLIIMSVSLLIEKVNGIEQNDSLPVSGQRSFVDDWLPLCSLYDLKWVPLFETGATFNQEDLPHILEELWLMKRHRSDVNNEHLQKRLEMLINKLETLKGQKTSFFIG